MRLPAATIGLLTACTTPETDAITVTLEDLQPGWLVTTSRFIDNDAPGESTVISDGSPITLTGTSRDVFVATITDASGSLIATRAMDAKCTLAARHRLDVPGDYATIQAAIDAAAPGDTVRVAPGVYHELVRLAPGVCLLGSGAKRTFLEAPTVVRPIESSADVVRVVDVSTAPGSVVAGFTVRGVAPDNWCAFEDPFACPGTSYAVGLFVGGTEWRDATSSAPPIIANNIFEQNSIGVMLYWHGLAVVRNNVFVNNRNGLIANHYGDRSLVANNVFFKNAERAIGSQWAFLDVLDNVIVGSGVGIDFDGPVSGHTACNVFFDNDVWAWGWDPERLVDGPNIFEDPKLVGSGDWHLAPDSPVKDRGCHATTVVEPDGSAPDVGAYGGPFARWADL